MQKFDQATMLTLWRGSEEFKSRFQETALFVHMAPSVVIDWRACPRSAQIGDLLFGSWIRPSLKQPAEVVRFIGKDPREFIDVHLC